MFSKKIKKVIKVDGMHCEHCANKVINALENIEGIEKVKVNLNTKEVLITSRVDIDNNLIKETISKLDYQVIE